jgi:EAL domain-containing protein (putative c-di-GMP-specific phosphodiesterase class I)
MRSELELVAVGKALESLDAIPEEAYMTINVSPETLRCDKLFQMLAHLPLRRLVFEVTEHAPIDDYDDFLHVLRRLARSGVQIAVDDAGAGYSSLRHILNLRPQTIKLDISLTRNLHRDRSRRALTAALSSFAAQLDATVIAEGIESEEELHALLEIGIALGQGYYLGRPSSLGMTPLHH